MRVFLTGANGFVGKYLCSFFEASGHTVAGIARNYSERQQIQTCDVLDTERLSSILSSADPDWIIHLAGVSNIADSQRSEKQTHEINYLGTLSALQAMHRSTKRAKFLFISSAHIYAPSN